MQASVRWLIFGLLIGLSTTALAGRATLNNARFWKSAAKTRVVFDLSADTQPSLFMLDDPLRLVIDLPHTKAADRLEDDRRGSGAIERIRTGIRHHTGLRIVLDLKHEVSPKSFMLDPDEDHGYRLVVDLRQASRQRADLRVAAAKAQRSESDEPALGGVQARDQSYGDSDTTADETADAMASAVSSAPVAEEIEASQAQPVGYTPQRPTKDIVIAIDPGHGGKDPGAHGPNGTLEKTVTLAIASRLKKIVDDQPHMHGVLTRSGDYYVGLRERMVEARKDKADFFISIHCDASPGGRRADGASVYALSHHGATSEHARWLARRENAADLVGGVSLKDKNNSLASFMLDLSQSASIEASLDAGKRVLTGLDGLGSLHKSKVQQAGFMVLKSPDIPSILVETNFISNPAEERKLKSSGYQYKLARAMLAGIKGYFASYRPATFIAEGEQHEVERGETLSEIAEHYGVSVSALRRYNDLDGNMIRIGAKLKIPPRGRQQVAGLR